MLSRINIIGLGAGDLEQLSLGVYRKITNLTVPLFVRTADHPVLAILRDEGVHYRSFDYVYQSATDFETVYQTIVQQLKLEAAKFNEIVYAVPGHPMLAERTVQLLLEQEEIEVHILGGQSYLDDLFTALKIDPIEGFQFFDATSFDRNQVNYTNHLVFCQVYDQMIASEVKLTLLEDLPPEHLVTVVEAAGSEAELIKTIPLFELDQTVRLSNLTSLYIPPTSKAVLAHQFSYLREIIATLRGPKGCPWDQKQTHESLRPYLVEEAYELIDAINQEDDNAITEELGDVLLHVMLHSQIGEDQGYFTIDDVIRTLSEKLIRRHPHVFNNTIVSGIEEVISNWQAIKAEEKGLVKTNSLLDRVPESSSTLVKAEGLQKEAAKVGFDWDNPNDIWAKVHEEIREVQTAIQDENQWEIEAEFGDLIFAIVNLARYYKINSDLALNRMNAKFTKRFHFIEQVVRARELNISELSLQQLDKFWEMSKQDEEND
ncbi:tetrapyrrole methylase family protein / MazG family protein [Amphibacillus marinus]|uniref:Tetrapyrrole methylase family protein / MazG family protein n=1 Tax=Amphibacillus marinus TaxID=872970 RepID=A0A1H8TLS5_9BACI|nr:nucleoside triphosphate pyrophosphohydrolase [Amphibacillus marinus]SEO92019.1 tetrapyrrole methylase family protein / MazG family protein [Amphibacillus marinus]